MKSLIENFSTNESRSFRAREVILDFNDPYLHTHDLFELVYMHNCKGKRFIGDNIENFEGDEIAFLGPNLPHCWQITSTDPENPDPEPRAVVIHFDKNFFKNILSAVPELKPMLKLSELANQGIIFKDDGLLSMWNTFREVPQFDSIPLRFVRTMEVIATLNNYIPEPKASHGYSLRNHKTDFQKINKAYEFVNQNYQNDIRIDEIASLINLSKTSFCRYFKKMTKKSFFDYVKEVRIAQACKLLIETDMSVSEICYKCGYNTLANFNKQFKQITSTNPQQYRLKY